MCYLTKSDLALPLSNLFRCLLSDIAKQVILEAIEEWERVLPCLGTWTDIKQLRSKPKAYIQFYSGQG
jgi:hypothetical protein